MSTQVLTLRTEKEIAEAAKSLRNNDQLDFEWIGILLSKGKTRQAFDYAQSLDTAMRDLLFFMRELPDDENPQLLFSCTHTQLLVQIANGMIDPVASAKAELANRGLNLNGEWVGFKNSKEA